MFPASSSSSSSSLLYLLRIPPPRTIATTTTALGSPPCRRRRRRRLQHAFFNLSRCFSSEARTTEEVLVPGRKDFSLLFRKPRAAPPGHPVILHVPFHTPLKDSDAATAALLARCPDSTIVTPRYSTARTPNFPRILHDVVASALHIRDELVPESPLGLFGTGVAGALCISTALTTGRDRVRAVAVDRPVADLLSLAGCRGFAYHTWFRRWVVVDPSMRALPPESLPPQERAEYELRERVFGADPAYWVDPFASPVYFLVKTNWGFPNLAWLSGDDEGLLGLERGGSGWQRDPDWAWEGVRRNVLRVPADFLVRVGGGTGDDVFVEGMRRWWGCLWFREAVNRKDGALAEETMTERGEVPRVDVVGDQAGVEEMAGWLEDVLAGREVNDAALSGDSFEGSLERWTGKVPKKQKPRNEEEQLEEEEEEVGGEWEGGEVDEEDKVSESELTPAQRRMLRLDKENWVKTERERERGWSVWR